MNKKLFSIISISFIPIVFCVVIILKRFLINDMTYDQYFTAYITLIMVPLLMIFIYLGLSLKKYLLKNHTEQYRKLSYRELTDSYSFNSTNMVKFILFSKESFGDKKLEIIKWNYRNIFFSIPISFICFAVVSAIFKFK